MSEVDPIAAWRAAYARVRDLVSGLDEEQLATSVPACPDWTVHDLLAHVVGLGADVLAGDEPDDHNPEWTARQVASRRDRSAADLLAEWAALVDPLVAWMAEHGSRPLNDVVIHEQDLRGAVGVPGGDDGSGFALVRDRMADRFAAAVEGRPRLALVSASEAWTRVVPDGDVEDAETELRAPAFDLARALVSRRTADQLRSWTVRGDVDPYLDAFAGLGDLPEHPLPEQPAPVMP